jgi:DNA-binding NarL/FixJ family response regulator
MATRVLLADDHVLVRESLKTLLEGAGIQVVGQASNGHDALRLIESLKPEIAVLDISMPVLNGLDAMRAIRVASPKTRIILLTQHDEQPYVSEALEAGANGYVLKSQVSSDLIQAIRQVGRGEVYLSPQISAAVMEAYNPKTQKRSDPLTPRERQVLQLIAEGKTTRDLASVLGISVKTAESHRTRLMQKLDIHDTATLVLYAVRRGIVQP